MPRTGQSFMRKEPEDCRREMPSDTETYRAQERARLHPSPPPLGPIAGPSPQAQVGRLGGART